MTTGTQIHYYHLCKRKLWLFSNGIQMEQDSALVAEGKFIHETTYKQRASKYKELDFGYVKIDHYDAQNKVVHEVKKSNKLAFVHEAQLKYYLYVLHENGIKDATGILEYPKIRQTKNVELNAADIPNIENWIIHVQQIISNETCPPEERKSYCKNCAYYDFCFV